MMTDKNWKPQVGDAIHVRTQYTFGGKVSTNIKSGIVVKSERQDPHDTFRLYTGNPQYPVSLIAFERVTGIKLRKAAA
jgi:hypothetical protein